MAEVSQQRVCLNALQETGVMKEVGWGPAVLCPQPTSTTPLSLPPPLGVLQLLQAAFFQLDLNWTSLTRRAPEGTRRLLSRVTITKEISFVRSPQTRI